MSLVHSPDQDQVKLARALVSPDKSVRDKTCATLASYLSATTSMTDMEMLKFWKALYFTVWLSDKAAVQLELTQNISKLLTSCSKKSLKIQFVRMYFRTLQREWLHLDQYRIDKFYKLTRFLLRESLIYLHSKGWPAKLSEELLGAIEDESLTKTPNGIRFHLADIYLDELYTATNGELSNTQFLVALRPFLRALGKATDGTFLERVNKRVVGDYLVRYARERPIVEGEDGSGAKFSSVNTQVLQASVFDIASEESTLERNRKLLYALHKAFPEVTKVQFADIDMNDLAAMDSIVDTQSHGHEHGRNTSTGTDSGTGTGSSGKEPAVATTQAGKKKGKKQGKIADAMADVDAENATETHHKANKKRTAGELGGDHVSTTAAETAAASTSGVKAKKQKVAPRDEGDEGASAKKGVCAPASSAADEIDNLFDKTTRNGGKNKKASIADNGDRGSQSDAAASKELPSAPAPAPAQFIKAKKFAGAKPGYVFKKDRKGLGYYMDELRMKAMKREQEKSAKKQKQKQSAKGDRSGSNGILKNGNAAGGNGLVHGDDKKVRFGRPQSIGYVSSVNKLKSSTPQSALSTTPVRGVLKHNGGGSASSSSSGGSSEKARDKNGAFTMNTKNAGATPGKPKKGRLSFSGADDGVGSAGTPLSKKSKEKARDGSGQKRKVGDYF